MESPTLTKPRVKGAGSRAADTPLEAIRALSFIPAWSATEYSAAGLLRISRSAAYNGVKSGDIPARRVGGKVLVPVPLLLAAFGLD